MVPAGLAIAAVVGWSAVSATAAAELLSDGASTARVTGGLARVSAVLTAIAVIAQAAAHGPPSLLTGGGTALLLAAVVGAGAAVAVARSQSLRGVLALAAPLSAALAAGFLLAPRSGAAPSQVGTLVLAHVVLVHVGVGGFALAAVMGALHLVQERQLRTRNFGRLFQRLPSLDELDAANFRLVAWGFMAYSAALLIGFVWVEHASSSRSPARVVLAVVAWALFAAVIHTRVTMGWRGRRAAIMTIAGCVATFAVLAGYLMP